MILNSPTISGSLTVTGNILTSGSITLSGSVASASFAATSSFVALAQSASNAVSAQTASFANVFTVANTLTAQTLVVQTITSSVDFVTGSTRFGSLLANTHVFSGSVTMNPGGLFVSGSGLVGIGTTTPSFNLDVNGTGRFTGALTAGSTINLQYNGTTYFQQYIGSSGDLVFYNNTANAIGMYTNGSERFKISSAGSVGIGTSTPFGKFNVYAGSNLSFVIQDSGIADTIELTNYSTSGGIRNMVLIASTLTFTTAIAGTGSGTERMRITSAGNVGIGTSSPSTLLHINSTTTQITLQNTDGGSNAERVGMFMTGGDTFKLISLNDNNTTRVDNILVANILNGNVGIGTSSPNGLLSLKASLSDTPALRFQNNITSGLDAALSTYVSSTQTYLTIGTNCYINSTGNIVRFNTSYESSFIAFDEGTLRFSTGTTSANPLTKLSVAPSGKITLDQSAYFVCGTTGFRFNNSTDAFNNFVALDNGNATLRGTLTQNSSDERLKNNIQIIPNALNKISQLRGVTFEWNQEIYETSRTTDIGVIAQDVQSVLPDAVTLAPFDTNFETNTSKSGENYLTVYYEKLIPLLIEGMKELKAQNDDLQSQINELKAQ